MGTGKDIIPGIHNYCDRWCERCFFTSRCSVYEEVKELSSGEQDVHNKVFWDNLAKNFAKTIELIHQAAASYGIDLTTQSAEEEKEMEEKRKQLRNKVEEHKLTRLGLQYANESLKWLKVQPGIAEAQQELISKVQVSSSNLDEVAKEAAVIKDCVKVIEWYSHFIYVKLSRALHGKLDDDWEEEDDFQTDANGSARVALLAIERSLQAWLKLYELIPAREDDFLSMLVLLQKIKNATEAEFPNVLKFKHPFYEESQKERE